MSHVLSFNMPTGNVVLDLRRATPNGTQSGAGYFHATRLQVTLIKNGGAAATAVVAPVEVADSDAAPAAATIALQTAGNAGGSTFMDSAANPTLSIGIPFSKGYSADQYREPTATHLLVTCSAAGVIQIVVD